MAKRKNAARRITEQTITAYLRYLREAERSEATIQKYSRAVRLFAAWLGGQGRAVTRDAAVDYKQQLAACGKSPVTVNTNLAALNSLFIFMGWHDCRVRYLKVQKRMFRAGDRDLTREEYMRLVLTARNMGKQQLALIMETICSTGIRVSELKYITVAACNAGEAQISLKGKIRVIILPGELVQKLLRYAKKQGIAFGEIFRTKTGSSIDRREIWAQMKRICVLAGVQAAKVFPHNLRHLFATTFYKSCMDIAKLADILGHSSVETTRIYLLEPCSAHRRLLEGLGLVI